MGIVSYAGPSTAAVFAAGVINEAWDMATTLDQEAAAAKNKAVVQPPASAPKPDHIDPEKFQATDSASNTALTSAGAEAVSARVGLTSKRAAIVADVANDARSFMRTFFADSLDGTAPYDDASRWIDGILKHGGSGVAVEQQLWQRDAQRIGNDTARALDDVMVSWAARGARLPNRSAQYQQRAAALIGGDMLGAAERSQRVRSWDAEVAATDWSIERAVELRHEAMDKSRVYIAEWLKARYDQVTSAVTDPIQHQNELRKAYYGYMTRELALRDVAIDEYVTDYRSNKMRRWRDKEALREALLDLRVKALEHELQALALRTAGALNSIHVSAQAQAQESL